MGSASMSAPPAPNGAIRATGLVRRFGMIVFILLAGVWGLVFTGFPYAIALKTGSPTAVASSFILFFPLAFLTTSTLPARHSRAGSTRWPATTPSPTSSTACAH
jgi:ABC-2 type transport system permease protein